MTKFFRYLCLFLFLFFGVAAVMMAVTKSDYAGLLDQLYFAIQFSCIVMSILLIAFWSQSYKDTKNKVHLMVLFLPLILFLTVFGIHLHHSQRKNVPFFLRAGISGLSIELRNDSTYRMNSIGDFVADSYYGDFLIIGDTIKLKNAPLTTGKFLLVLSDKNNSASIGTLQEIVTETGEHSVTLPVSIYKRSDSQE